MDDIARTPLERPGYACVFDSTFRGPALDRSQWLPFYLPHWASRAAAAARYTVGAAGLTLTVAPDQPPWCPEFDGGVRVSSLQTGAFSGPLGSAIGQHRFRDGLRVREPQEAERLYVPRYGYVEMRARMALGPGQLAALWMIGFEEVPAHSGEITIMEIFGDAIDDRGTGLGHGIKPLNDPALRREFWDERLDFDPRDWHVYAADWSPSGVAFFLDGRQLHRTTQSPDYPMQLMLNVYELAPAAAPPPVLMVDYVRGYVLMRTLL